MARSPLPEDSSLRGPGGPWSATLSPEEATLVLDIADATIVEGLRGSRLVTPPKAELPQALQRVCGVFVTLLVDGRLNGCIGSIEGYEPLGQGVAHNAWSAAFADHRLPELTSRDYDRLLIEVSVLSALDPILALSRRELLAQLRPGIDGLVISAQGRRAVFLPSVWEQLPDRGEFLSHLERKAGLPDRTWPMAAERFTAERYERRAGAHGVPHHSA